MSMALWKRKTKLLVTICLSVCLVLFFSRQIVNMNKIVNVNKLDDFNISQFEGIMQIFEKTRLNSSQMSTLECQNPDLDPFEPTLMKFYKKVPPLDCSKTENWVSVSPDGSSVSVRKDILEKYGAISCNFRDILRDSEFTNSYGSFVNTHRYNFTRSDFVEVACVSPQGGSWTNIVAGIRSQVDLLPEDPRSSSQKRPTIKKKKWAENDFPQKLANVVVDSPPKMSNVIIDSPRKIPNVVVIGYDSISRNQYIRMMPRTYELMTREGAIMLNSYNIVGDGTPAAVIPILTGMKEDELPETKKSVKGAKFVGDVYPFIWKDFKKAGYVTMFGEDTPSVGTFTFRLTGFNETPTDHYMHSFYREHKEEECFKGTPAHVVSLQLCMNALRRYRERPVFLWSFHGLLSHDDYNNIQKVDADLESFILDMKKENILDDTIFILFSDHGPRFSSAIRSTLQGKLEERMPMVSLLFPHWFKSSHPDIHKALLLNQNRLSTPFDLHDTLKDILHGTVSKPNKERSQSLFSPIPSSRSCSSAGVAAHWCACMKWENLDHKNKITAEAAKVIINTINKHTEEYRHYCQVFKLVNIQKSLVAKTAKEVRHFVRKVVTHNGKQFLGFDTDGQESKPEKQIVQVALTADPGEAKFEATLKFVEKSHSFVVKIGDISRINVYGDQPACIQNINPDLRKFCVCKRQ